MQISVFYKKLITGIGLILFSYCSYSAEQERYLHFTEVDGLPRNITTCLEQDQYGYLWIGTANGIARYDGKNFYCYKELSNAGIIYLLYDSRNILWVASDKGLYKYNRLTNYFELKIQGYITKVQEDNGGIYFLMLSNINKMDGNKILNIYKGNEITDFCFSKEGIWLGKSNDGVSLLSRESGFTKITASYLQNVFVSNITKIDDKLLIGCYNGQLYSILGNGKLLQIEISNHYYFKKIVKVGQEIWLATDGNGIIILDKDLHFSRILSRSKNIDASIISNSIYDILPGNNLEIWLASYGAGLTCILPDNLLFQNVVPEKGNENSLVANEGISVFIKKPTMYFGTNYGLSVWNENTQRFKNLNSEKLRMDLKGTKVSAIIEDLNNIWVGTYDGLLGKYTLDYELIKTYHPSSSGPEEMQQIVLLRKINRSNLLILTQFQSRILLNFNIAKETTRAFELYAKGSNITYCLLNSIRENQKGELLALISDKGLFHVNWKENVLENKLQEMNKRIDCYITDFYHDKKGNYWFASTTDGLLCVSEDGKKYKKWTVVDGLPSNTLIRIESADDRFLWISTISGIFRFDTETGQTMNFNHGDGLPANEFLERVSAKTNDGRIIFGSTAGFTIVDPSKVKPDTIKTEVIISDITFQNQSIRSPEGKQYLKQPLEDTKELWLPYNKNSFSIYFFAKEKSFIKYHNYAYRLAGLEKNMNFIGEANYATYTNLSPGTYTFEVISSDNKTQKGIPTRFIIHIQSPWYLCWYAYLAYAIICITIMYLSVYAYLKRMELRREKEMSEFKIQKEQELSEKKLAFFTNISHDLKTPLTLIDAPVNDLLQSENLNQEQINRLMVIRRNSKRLYKLITDLLDFRKITQKQYVLEVKETAISDILTEVYEAFKEECKNKSIELAYTADQNLIGFVDAKKIEKIVWNLMSNAVKFTYKGGTISLYAEEMIVDGTKHLKLIVSDKGIGISEDNKNKIFDRFFKVQQPEPINQEGTGIGLSIVKELVEIHHGKIQVESELGSGTTFIIILPSDKECFSDNELVRFEISDYQIPEVEKSEINPHTDSTHTHYNLPRILVVEDNSELREYLAGHFMKRYKVYEAEDGFAGIKLAKEVNPDIILTDVQMPNMNGYEFCKEIRHNFDISHIPVIMLTANNTIEHQIEGLSTGADAYLTKPFDIKLLDAQVNSLLENRKAIRNKFLGIETQENLEKTLPQKDIDFIFELKLFIEENMMKQDLNVELLSEHFTVSLAQLHRKIRSLTGSTPNNLIKSIRLRKAYKLIRESGFRVSEAAYQTGFSDPNYFTICFKKEFGENPSQIVATLKDSADTTHIDTKK